MTFRQYNSANLLSALLMAVALLLLPACSTPKAERYKTVEVGIPIPIPCIKEFDLPKAPGRLGETPYPPNRADREALMAAHIIDQSIYIETVQPLLRACSAPFEEPSK
ncbi:MAG: hypothetical protein INF91_00280 [Alphaproteobacteria bacterium]|nr:hypothetical protein [Alphaproteobacteria bacterium]